MDRSGVVALLCSSEPMPESETIRRVFLGWDASPLPGAVAELRQRYRQKDELDLGQVIVVVPGRRAGRRFLEWLVDASEAEHLVLTTPNIITESELPELLYEQRRPLASPLVQTLAWLRAIRTLEPRIRDNLIPHPPRDDEELGWFRIADVIRRVHVDISADGHTIDSVLSMATTIPGFDDRSRWEALRLARQSYHVQLDAVGTEDRDAARLSAIERNEIACESDIVLIGMIDFNAIIAAMLSRVSGRVTALIAAPADESARFDAFGRLKSASWQDYSVPIRDRQVSYAEDHEGQADAAATWLASHGGRFPVEQVVIGVPDPTVIPLLRRRLADGGVRLRWLDEKTIGDSGPYRLLAAAVRHASSPTYDTFASLVRHPDLSRWLESTGDSIDLAGLDKFYADCLPATLSGPTMGEYGNLSAVIRRVEGLLRLIEGRKSIDEWAKAFAKLLNDVYSERKEWSLDSQPDRVLYESLTGMLKALSEVRQVPGAMAPSVSASDAFAMAFETVSRDALPPSHDPETIELLGWLELPWDTASAVFVTTFNDGFVPTFAGADPFLPDALRARLEIENNARRYARDAYLTTLLTRSREFACVVARRDAGKNPLLPSRLLFTGPDAEVVERAQRWSRSQMRLPVSEPAADRPSPFAVPQPTTFPRTKPGFRITELRDYLACKYRYYLKHVRGLAAVTDTEREFSGAAFGSLIHSVLEAWGNDRSWRECGDADELAQNLVGRLSTIAEANFPDGRPAIRLQVAQAARRFRGFAVSQASLVADGWRVVYAERDRQSLTAPFAMGDGNAVELIGRIDRIDYNPATNTARILDYKTGDKALPPEKAHRRDGAWIDLQLPLYRHLWRRASGLDDVPANANVELAYFQIPRDPQNAGVAIADSWDRAALDDADAVARQVIADIQAEVFWPPADPAPANFEEFAAICLDGLNAPPIDADDEGAP